MFVFFVSPCNPKLIYFFYRWHDICSPLGMIINCCQRKGETVHQSYWFPLFVFIKKKTQTLNWESFNSSDVCKCMDMWFPTIYKTIVCFQCFRCIASKSIVLLYLICKNRIRKLNWIFLFEDLYANHKNSVQKSSIL